GAPRAVFDELVARVASGPPAASYGANGVVRDGVLTPAAFATGVINYLYDEARGWPALAAALRAAAGGQGGPLLLSADQYYRRSADGSFSPMVEANAVISCVDHPETRATTPAQ